MRPSLAFPRGSLLASSLALLIPLGACSDKTPQPASEAAAKQPEATPSETTTATPAEPTPRTTAEPAADSAQEPVLDEPELAEAEGEPAPYPESTTPDPAAFVHPAADVIIVVASNRSFSPGEDGVDRDAKYHSFIWSPTQGALPAAGKAEAAEPGGAALVGEVDGLIVADGSAQWQVFVDEPTIPLPKCSDACEGGAAVAGKQTLAKKLHELRAQPFVDGVASGDSKLLIAGQDFARHSADTCIGTREAVEHVLQVAAVADGRVFVVERILDTPFCATEPVSYELRRERIFDLRSGEVSLAALENELTYKERKSARFKAAETLAGFSKLSATKLAPVTISIAGLFPTFREFKGGMRLILQYAAPVSIGGSGGWGNLFDAAQVTIKYPESSSVTPPADVVALMTYVQREHGNWKVIGWSQVDAGGADADAIAGAGGLIDEDDDDDDDDDDEDDDDDDQKQEPEPAEDDDEDEGD